MEQRVWGFRVVVMGVLALASLTTTGVAAQGDPIAPPPGQDDYYVPPGYLSDPPPPGQPYPAPAQPYPAPVQPQAQPYPQPQPYPQAQPYPAQPYAQPYQDPAAQPSRGRRRLERLRGDEPVPPGVEVIERRRLVLTILGAGIFGVSYGMSVAIMVDGGLESRRLLVPVIGPLLENGHGDYFSDGVGSGADGWGFAILGTAVQAVGLTLFAIGMRRQRYAVYYVDTARGRTLTLSPGAGPRGLSLHMAF